MLLFLSVMVLLLALANSTSNSFSELYLVKGGRLLGFSLRDKLYAHLQKLSLAFFGRQRTGDLLTRVTGDVTALEEFAVKSLKDIAGSVFLITLTLGTLFIIDWHGRDRAGDGANPFLGIELLRRPDQPPRRSSARKRVRWPRARKRC